LNTRSRVRDLSCIWIHTLKCQTTWFYNHDFTYILHTVWCMSRKF